MTINRETLPATLLALALLAGPALAQEPARLALAGREAAAPERARLGSVTPEQELEAVYQRFYESYRLAPDDEIAIHVLGQPDYTVEKVKISPLGRVFHPLLGDVQAAGLSVDQLTARLREELGEFIINPQVSVSLRETNGAKVGVLGEVIRPGVIVMARPMTVLDAIAAAGGFNQFSKSSSVMVLRQQSNGAHATIEVDMKRVLAGKAAPGENVALQPGDTIVVKANRKKTLAFISSLAGLGGFFDFMRR